MTPIWWISAGIALMSGVFISVLLRASTFQIGPKDELERPEPERPGEDDQFATWPNIPEEDTP